MKRYMKIGASSCSDMIDAINTRILELDPSQIEGSLDITATNESRYYTTNSRKITSKYWPQFCDLIETQWGYGVDSVDKQRYSQFITLFRDGYEYDAEVTKYSDGTYELLLSNITEIGEYE